MKRENGVERKIMRDGERIDEEGEGRAWRKGRDEKRAGVRKSK